MSYLNQHTHQLDDPPIRRAADREIQLAHAWVDQTTEDWADYPDNEKERQAEYERALEIIIFANGGRHAPPPSTITWTMTDGRQSRDFNIALTVNGGDVEGAEAAARWLADFVRTGSSNSWRLDWDVRMTPGGEGGS